MADDETRLPAGSRPYLAARSLALVAGLVGAVVTARWLGPEGRGALGLFVFAVALASAILGIGLPTAVYDVTARRVVQPVAAMRAGRVIAAVAGVLAAVSLAIVATMFGWPGGARADVVAIAGGIAVGAGLVVTSGTMALIASGATRRAALAQALPAIVAALGYVVALVVLDGGVVAAIVAATLAQVVSIVAVVGVGRRGLASSGPRPSPHHEDPNPAPAPRAPLRATIRTLLTRGLRVEASDVANILSYRIDTLLVASLAGLATLGRYSVGVQLLEPLWVAASAFAMSVMGAAAASRTDGPALEGTVGVSIRASVLVCLVGGILGIAIMAIAGELILGPGYASVPVVMIALLPGVAALAASKVLAGAVIGRGGIGVGSVVATLTVVLNVVLNLVLVPRFGDVGAALSSTGSYGFSSLLWLHAWRRRGGAVGARDLVPRPADARALWHTITGRFGPGISRP